jgi:hypothetical protein
MDFESGLLEPGRWQWIIDHAVPFFFILAFSALLTATVVWLVLRARYQRSTAKIRLQLKEFGEKLHGATPDEARRRIESLQARLAHLEPRRLTGRQKTVLQEILTLPESAGMTDINVAHDAACGDGKQYAADFVQVLGSCRGWRPSSVTMFGSDHRPEAGLAIVCFSRGRTAAGAKLLSKALTEAGIDHETVHSTEEQLELVITSRLSAHAGQP